MKIKLSSLMILLVSSIALTACSSTTSTIKKVGHPKQALNYIEKAVITTTDPSLAADEVSLNALNNVDEGIYRLDKDHLPQPAGAAEKATLSKDGKTYTIKLRKNATWSDGKPVKAQDYVYSWQRTVDPKLASTTAYFFKPVKNADAIAERKMDKSKLGIKAIGDYQLEITLNKPTPYFEYLLTLPTFFPQRSDIVKKFGDQYAAKSQNAVYNGPFVLSGYQATGSNDTWSYVKNSHYWDRHQVKLDKVNLSVVKEGATALNLFKQGQVDTTYLASEFVPQMKNDPSFLSIDRSSTSYLEFNKKESDSPYRNVNLRKAISYAINRKELVNNVLANGATEAVGLVPKKLVSNPKTHQDFTEETNSVIQHDANQAKSDWNKAKKELNISSLEMNILTDDMAMSKKMAEYLQATLSETLPGLKVSITSIPFSVLLDRVNKGDFQVAIAAWGADYADPTSFLELFTTKNFNNHSKYTNKKYDELVDQAMNSERNQPEERWNKLVKAENILMNDMGVVPLYYSVDTRLCQAKVKNIIYHPINTRYELKWASINE
ncbi:peptide ABC transporter substrate-binding protein [Melissococcus plutonius]|uniref:peptide ABC transporter substrate-binding protein n=1 Tax=Melissococcus plutonius TaxID=33970 RepID=UPI003C2F2D42